MSPQTGDTREGFFYALSAYLLWGFLPFYMKAVAHVSAIEIVAHRILWSVPLAGAIIILLGRTDDLKRAISNPVMLAQAALTAAIISINWSIYVWAIATDQALEAALGYYINPLFSIFLAYVFLGERLNKAQLIAIGFAAAAVALLTWHAGGLPWVAVGLTVTWGFYALFKRMLPIGPTQGFFLEVLLLCIPAFVYVVWLETKGVGHFVDGNLSDTFLLCLAGAVTAIPLMLYATGAKLLRLSTIGIMQYIAPTMIFLIAIFIFREPFDYVRLTAFCLIWTAIAIYSWSLLRERSASTVKSPSKA
ncbi:MAG: EamA family transporter RarD [Rhizobiaceae bacterium]